jgi:hypothetical protein
VVHTLLGAVLILLILAAVIAFAAVDESAPGSEASERVPHQRLGSETWPAPTLAEPSPPNPSASPAAAPTSTR